MLLQLYHHLKTLNNWYDAQVYLVQNGFPKLGEGSYGTVYELSERLVLKISHETDYAYEEFVSICQAYPDDPHLPTIYYAGQWGELRVFILEKLQPLAGTWDERTYLCSGIRYELTGNEAWKVDINLPDTLSGTCGLLELLIHNHRLDLHTDNVMLRGETLVITDPVCLH